MKVKAYILQISQQDLNLHWQRRTSKDRQSQG